MLPSTSRLPAVPPNWFATVMGTGIVAVAATSLPWQPPGLHVAALVVWALASVLLLVVTAATVAHWLAHPALARGHLEDPAVAPFHGAAPMALLTVGAGTLLLGRDVLGPPTAVAVDAVLWTAGTVLGLATAVGIPALLLRAGRVDRRQAAGSWLMPVVPPMVSASTGALLVPHLPAGHARVALLLTCYALFAIAAVASAVVIAVAVGRLVRHGAGATTAVPTWWIVLGPLGQSVTAVGLLGGVAPDAVAAPAAGALQAFGLLYGVPVWGLAVAWVAVAVTLTRRAVRDHLPFSLAWWSFTFPVGTVVTASSGLALHTGDTLFRVAAVGLYAVLVTAWVTAAVRTIRLLVGSVAVVVDVDVPAGLLGSRATVGA